jgi:5-methylcytosine-specific restriction protein A
MKRSCRGFRCPALVEPPDYFCPACRENRKAPCREPGCPALVTWPDIYCLEHRRERERERGSASARGYGQRWREIRLAKLKVNPLCEMCEAGGMTEPATEVHHVLPLEEGGTNSSDNLMSLCRSCHEGTKKR